MQILALRSVVGGPENSVQGHVPNVHMATLIELGHVLGSDNIGRANAASQGITAIDRVLIGGCMQLLCIGRQLLLLLLWSMVRARVQRNQRLVMIIVDIGIMMPGRRRRRRLVPEHIGITVPWKKTRKKWEPESKQEQTNRQPRIP